MNKFMMAVMAVALTCFSQVLPETDAEVFSRAVELSKSGEFEQAVSLYKKLPESFNVNLNLASCYLCMDNYTKSLLFLKKAAKHAPLGQRARLSVLIDQARSKIGLAERQPGYWPQVKKIAAEGFFILSGISLIWLELLVLGLWVLFLCFFKIGSTRFAKVSSGAALAASLGLLFAVNFSQTTRRAIVVSPGAQMFSGPGNDFMLIGKADQGLECHLKKQAGEFFRVSSGKKKGWIKASDIAEI